MNVYKAIDIFSIQPTHLANFNQVQSIQYSAMEEKDRKGMLQLNVAGAAEVQFSHFLKPDLFLFVDKMTATSSEHQTAALSV